MLMLRWWSCRTMLSWTGTLSRKVLCQYGSVWCSHWTTTATQTLNCHHHHHHHHNYQALLPSAKVHRASLSRHSVPHLGHLHTRHSSQCRHKLLPLHRLLSLQSRYELLSGLSRHKLLCFLSRHRLFSLFSRHQSLQSAAPFYSNNCLPKQKHLNRLTLRQQRRIAITTTHANHAISSGTPKHYYSANHTRRF